MIRAIQPYPAGSPSRLTLFDLVRMTQRLESGDLEGRFPWGMTHGWSLFESLWVLIIVFSNSKEPKKANISIIPSANVSEPMRTIGAFLCQASTRWIHRSTRPCSSDMASCRGGVLKILKCRIIRIWWIWGVDPILSHQIIRPHLIIWSTAVLKLDACPS